MVPTSNGADEVDEHHEADPAPSGHHLAEPAHDLTAQCRRIGAGCVVGNDTESDDDPAEFAEAADGGETLDNEGAGRDLGGLGPGFVGKGTAAESDTDHVHKDEGKPETEEGHEEGDAFRSSFRVVDEEVGSRTAPGERHGHLKGEEGEAVGGDGRRGGVFGDDGG